MRESEVPDPGCQAQGCACLWVSRSGCIFVPWGSRDFCASMKVLVLAECLSCTVPGLYSLSPWESPPACCEAMWLDPLQRILSGWRLEERAVQYKRHRGWYQQQRAPPTPRKAKKRYSKRGGSARPSLAWRLPLMLERRSRKESGKDGASTWFQVSGPLLEASEAGRRQRDVAPRRPRASTGRAHGANGGAEAGEWGSRDNVQSEVLREAPLVVVEPEAEYALGSWRRQDRFLLPRVHLPVGWAAECRRAPSSRRWKPRAGNYRGITTKSRYFRTMPTWK